MIWGDFFLDLLDRLLDFMDGITLFWGISLWDLSLIFIGMFDLAIIISAIFQGGAKADGGDSK